MHSPFFQKIKPSELQIALLTEATIPDKAELKTVDETGMGATEMTLTFEELEELSNIRF